MRANKDKQILRHIIEYCKDVGDTIEEIGTVDKLLGSKIYRNALSMPLVQIGELARILSDGFKEESPDVPWSQIKGLRNHLVHSYGEIDWDRIWETAVNDIPDLQQKCIKIEQNIHTP